MRKPFTLIGVILLLLVAGVNLYYAYIGTVINVGGQMMPTVVNYVTAGIFGVVAILTALELKK